MIADLSDSYIASELTLPSVANDVKSLYSLTVHRFSDEAFITYHEHDKDGNLLPGKIVEAKSAVDALSKTIEQPVENGWISNRVLFDSPDKLIWSRPSGASTLWFRGGRDAEGVHVIYPRLVFCLNRKTKKLYCFAAAKKAPTKDTRLYVAPVMNVYQDGSLCQGTATLPSNLAGASDELLTACENTLFDSQFTHVNNPFTFKNTQGKDVSTAEHMNRWRTLSKENRAPTTKELTKLPFTIKELAQRGVML
ncbi:MAG: hypothetical protein CMF12_08495 [Idiomarina sp.]|uniref:hypothetical protein n=1 Tax=Idiomarina sp. TaxID=1874361 RepID=UPI000C689B6F|nr:hypothetical protein [Idiomarina sp.]MBT42548.1 hypothetical protein [Idiomarina sp.]|tara:strand:+ start:489 stop:1241 length:753 start_codon:yes stop_codon:yes gene_type:complete